MVFVFLFLISLGITHSESISCCYKCLHIFAPTLRVVLFCLWFPLLNKVVQLDTMLLFLFLFSLLQEVGVERLCCSLCQFLPVFSSKTFIVSSVAFRSLVYFESIFFCMMLQSVLISFFYTQLSSFPRTTCGRNCLSSIIYSCLLCQRLDDHWWVGLSLDFLFSSFNLYFCFCASTILFLHFAY